MELNPLGNLPATVHRAAMTLQCLRGTFTHLVLLAPVAVALVLLAACSGGASAKGTATTGADQEVEGVFVLKGTALWANLPADGPDVGGLQWTNPVDGGACQGRGGYADIAHGLQVLLKDGDTVLDVATFGDGHFTDTVANPTHYLTPQNCTFAFTLHVPPGHKFYTVSVGHRGDNTYNYTQITTPGTMSYTLGTQ